MPRRRSTIALLLPILLAAPAARAVEWGPFELHGFGEMQMRTYSEDYDPDDWVLSQWAYVLNLELEADILPDGWGPFDLVSGFARVEVRYECVYWGCFTPSWRYWGDDARSAPRNLTTGVTSPYTGILPRNESRSIHTGNELVDFFVVPPFDRLRELGATNVDATFAPISEALFAVKKIDGVIGPALFPLGPWNPEAKIQPRGSLASVPNLTLPLPMRPEVTQPRNGSPLLEPRGLFIPSNDYRQRYEHFDDPEQNLSETDLKWNHGQGQDERELKEAYLDIEMFDARLWLRVGKQAIVWGKTELFRTTDQFNPQDLALSSLPSLEESRLALWSARGVWSFYDVGPLEDLRLELAVNVDDFEPVDLGRCGEPYTIWLVCGKTFGLWAHGFSGAGIAGEERPTQFFHDPGEGIELGARVEFRYGRFSFQISDFWGYDDAPVIDAFTEYGRRVDPLTGRPLDTRGRPLEPTQPSDEILALHPANRQLFDVVCSATLGIAGGFSGALAERCLVDLLNAEGVNLGLNIDPPGAISQVLGGSGGIGVGITGEAIIRILTGIAGRPVDVDLVELNQDPNDGVGTGIPGIPATADTALGSYLTDQQEALLGCGPFYGTDCDRDGVDLFNAEASVLLQSFPQFEPGGAVATRKVGRLPAILPGARGPFDDINRDGIPDIGQPEVPVVLQYDPLVDGCVAPGPGACAGARPLVDPRTGELFRSEMAALSYNFLQLLAALGFATGTDEDCDPTDPVSCAFVRGVFDIAGSRRPEVRAGGNGEYGRRDFSWHGGSELVFTYERRNVLGFAFDFAEDVTKTNWSIEATWVQDQPYAVVDRRHGISRNDTFNLTVSVDRPTFVNFLNPNRTFFVNSQWFFRWIDDYRQGGFIAHGPLSVLGTLTIATGYHQDRLLPALTWVHDIRTTSGGLIGQVTYRFSPSLSATVGTAAFYGKPEPIPMALRQPLLGNATKNYEAKVRYDGLIPIAERDEVFLLLRYTF